MRAVEHFEVLQEIAHVFRAGIGSSAITFLVQLSNFKALAPTALINGGCTSDPNVKPPFLMELQPVKGVHL